MSSSNDFSIGPLEELLRKAPRTADGRSSVPPTSDCPTEAEWFRAASGESTPEESLKLVDHAARCQACETLLQYWGTILKEDTPEEAAEIAKLPVSRSRWQERMAARLVHKEDGAKRVFFSRHYLLPVTIGLTGALAAVIFFLLLPSGFRSRSSPEQQLASAYSGRRQMDLRIPMAAFAPVTPNHRTRSAKDSTMSDSVPLLEAKAAITQALLKSPEDNHWLALEARADILNGDYDSAIDTLTRVLAADPSNVAALTDIASAYHLRAAATDTPSDQATALDYLEHAARLDSRNAVVLYNEAVVLDALCQYSVEIDTWKKFLQAEKDRKWLDDGRKRLQVVEAREKECDHNQSLLTPYLNTPDGMFQLARSPDLLVQHDEEIFTLYFPHLLQISFPTQTSESNNVHLCDRPCASARALLTALATSLEVHHHDSWLKDFLATQSTPGFAKAASLLGASLESDVRGDVGNGMKLADASMALFEADGNRTGILRAETERVFELEQLFSVDRCLQTARELAPELDRQEYPWLKAQFMLDASSCEAAKNNFATASEGIQKASAIASGAGYGLVELRALGFLADAEYFSGHRRAAWKANLEGMHRFWNGAYPLTRANQFYSNLTYDEEATPNLYTSVLFNEELLRLSSKLNHPSYEAVDRFRLIKAEVRAGEVTEAASQLPQAEAYLASVPGVDKLQGYTAETHLQLAEAYLAKQSPNAARQMLEEAASPVATLDVPYVNLGYEEAMGKLAMQEHRRTEAQMHLDHALSIAEENFRHLNGREERATWSRSVREAYAASTLLRIEEGQPAVQALAVWERYRMMSSGLNPQDVCRLKGFACLAPALAQLSKSLDGQTVLGTIVVDQSLISWSMDRDGVRAQLTMIDPKQLDRLMRTFEDLAATPESSEASLRVVGLQLVQGPLKPLLPMLVPGRQLLLDFDETMESLPVAALPLPDGGYAGKEISFSRVRTLLASDHARRTGEPVSGSALIVGASLPDPAEASPLPEAKSEALSVASYLNHPTVLTGEAATARSMEQAMPGSWLIHFAGHTMSNSGQTRLILARDPAADDHQNQAADNAGLFHEAALRQCRIVVLSACSTGGQEEPGFPEPSSLVDQLADDGIPDIVATHWDVDSEAAVPLMKSFYSGLAQGLTVPQALTRADVVVGNLDAYHHPYYWAAYYVTGMGKFTLKERIHDRTSNNLTDSDHTF